MKALYYLMSFGVGILLAIHLAMNNKVGELTGNKAMGNALFWLCGGIAALIVALIFNWSPDFFTKLKTMPDKWLLTAGAVGALFVVFGYIYLFGKIDVLTVLIIAIAGQIATAQFMGHFEWLSLPSKINWLKIVGMVVMITGVAITLLSDRILGKS